LFRSTWPSWDPSIIFFLGGPSAFGHVAALKMHNDVITRDLNLCGAIVPSKESVDWREAHANWQVQLNGW